jgi:heme/copper-type cytochrome/quinol oxidase subunit 1
LYAELRRPAFAAVFMAAAGIYTMGGAFWKFGQPVVIYQAVPAFVRREEDHDNNPIKMGIG